jgi:hypothetical protein
MRRKLILSVGLILASLGANADETPVIGDVNNDGSVTVADVTALVNIINGTSPNPYQDAEVNIADVDKNGNVNKSDITALVNIILGKSNDDDPDTPGISDEPVEPGIILDEARGWQGSDYWDE